ncbi:polysulfide reductase NrfD [Geomonas sp. Red32]|uniref:NrfD/PsrC family molybdoenzyme membrane anchor subunit n=1 Tax=Geomonas sp. Red32 TaxID=2912856 RepID=UPI00202CEC54|nr:NrfD/PsrC family molybdoenzyme membrane anchor subunit [Geomonas sp. Red32]MCM0082137.1 polysulfide reductase NrfD [Geomonas sp. Red32]
MELTVTGANAITSPHLHVWDWRVSLYLFLGGLSAGLAIMTSILHVRKGGKLAEGEIAAVTAPLYVPLILSIGMFFIFLDLERKLNVFWFYLTVQPLSPMSWGSWGLLVFYPICILYALAMLPDQYRPKLTLPFLINLSERLRAYRLHLAACNFGMGIFIGIYTGVLLSSFVARPLWNSAILPVLFLTSAMSAGAAFMIMIAKEKKVKLFFTKVDIWLILAEMVLLPLFFYGQYTSSGAHRESILPFFTFNHDYFWYGLGLLLLVVILPAAMVLKFLEVQEDHGEELTPVALMKMNLSALLVLLGGLIIRFSFVYAGQLSHLS